MKTRKIIVVAIIFLSFVVIANAQPLPPTTPSGNPVPVEGLVGLLLIAMSTFGIIKLKRKNNP